ncbi:MAG: hypothetical protein HKN88_09490 [Gammaproteobacteria bacterium]|nr:hypothetical protein [Gammaproteobacteria bacterium]NNC98289.1 hypothetical protein [Gammaproteobacteria bacterium]NNM13609.1 hypothetical protein [Gammaproteobacteria bacterium]
MKHSDIEKRSGKRINVSEQIDELQEHFEDILEHQHSQQQTPEQQAQEKHWDLASSILDLVELHRTDGNPDEAVEQLLVLKDLFNTHSDWKNLGIGKVAIEEAFRLAQSTTDKKTARRAFKIGRTWHKQSDAITLGALEVAVSAAENAKHTFYKVWYTRLLKKENQRINAKYR